ncbi:response regulator [Frigoriglobus tundricola]|uniref:Chemotaxis protein methyltransferase CheR n=1 Tax=Frigoriglobus tundricola TaxID=2774151 RepID=A0A6M5Z498_9BACT|nr:response regulator [Frigoriglobus tundricola]QJX00545.1 Chemotaxis protein methyltransferase CheR [Frigoriglobus tundricola]
MTPGLHSSDQFGAHTQGTEPDNEQTSGRSGVRVMCVDDNVDAADSLGTLLTMMGYEVSVAHDAGTALAHVEEFRPQVCILDITLKETDWDGCRLARALRERPGGQDMMLMALTALGDYNNIQRIADSDFDLYFTKPIEMKDLTASLEDFATKGRPKTV